ncbi:MAG: hypothetical protein OSJ70_10230 [Bacilli bacterium]|nr:hypothetical protein [Bacilli bacterium]
MNKKEFILKLAQELNYDENSCLIINEILESNFFISKKSKNKIIDELVGRLDVEIKEAKKIYDTAIKIINNELKYKFRHPFKSKD